MTPTIFLIIFVTLSIGVPVLFAGVMINKYYGAIIREIELKGDKKWK